MAETQRTPPKSPSTMSTRRMSRELAARRASLLSQASQRRASSSRRGTHASVDPAFVDPSLDMTALDYWANLFPDDYPAYPAEANGQTYAFDSTPLDFSNSLFPHGASEQPFIGDPQFNNLNQFDGGDYDHYGNFLQGPQMTFNPLAAIPRGPTLAPSAYVDPNLTIGGDSYEDFGAEQFGEDPLFVPHQNPRKRSLSVSSAASRQPYKKQRTYSQASSSNYTPSAGSKVSSHRSSHGSYTDTSSQARRRKQGNVGRNASTFADGRLKVGDRPKMDPEKPWVRINATTEGKTTRTAKINRYKPEYEDHPHPVGDWSSTRFDFKYTKDGEFKDKVMKASKIKEYILEYPRNKKTDAKLIIWIQKGPTDSARRYRTTSWSKCRFAECPAQQHQTGTILHGHYRVAFDEKFHKYGASADPFLVSGYAHLYCMERFLDFPEIVRRADVRVDTRSLVNEPSGKFAATLAGQPEGGVAESFVKLALQGGRHGVQKEEQGLFRNYPRHPATPRNAPKDHFSTLTYAMTKFKADLRPPAQCKQFIDRGQKPTHLLVNFGDLNMAFSEVAKDNRRRKKQAKAKRNGATEAEEEEDDEDALAEQKKRAVEEATRNLSHRAKQKGRRFSPHAGRKRRNDDIDSDTDSDDAFDQSIRRGKRQKHFTVHDGDESDEYEEPEAVHANPETSSAPPDQPIRRSHRSHNKIDSYNIDKLLDDNFESQPANDEVLSELSHFQDDEYAADIPDDLEDLLRANLGEYNANNFLNRRKSSTLGYGRRNSSLRSSLSNRKSSADGRRVSFGGNSTLEFDQLTPIRRYSTRSHDRPQSGRVLRSRSPPRSPLKTIRE